MAILNNLLILSLTLAFYLNGFKCLPLLEDTMGFEEDVADEEAHNDEEFDTDVAEFRGDDSEEDESDDLGEELPMDDGDDYSKRNKLAKHLGQRVPNAPKPRAMAAHRHVKQDSKEKFQRKPLNKQQEQQRHSQAAIIKPRH